jgi:quercetin dioxygenase-like cupin family protein
MSPRRLRTVLLSLVGVALLAAAYTAGLVQGAAPKTAVREALAASSSVRGVKDKTLGLTRVTIPAGVKLALHHHPGTQIASIQAGTLTYSVKTGSVTVRSGSADAPKIVRTIKAGQTAKIRKGQWIVEQPTEIHHAANNGKSKVVILLATLFPKGAPPSIPND